MPLSVAVQSSSSPPSRLPAFALLAAGCGGGGRARRESRASPPPIHDGVRRRRRAARGRQTRRSAPAGGGQGGQFQISMNVGNATDGAKFSACMRKHGVPNFPDPNGQGVITIHSGMGIDPGSPTFRSARSVCQKLLAERRPADPGADRAAAAADARLLGLHARARDQGLPRPLQRRPPDPGQPRQRPRPEQPDLPEGPAGLPEDLPFKARGRRSRRRWLSAVTRALGAGRLASLAVAAACGRGRGAAGRRRRGGRGRGSVRGQFAGRERGLRQRRRRPRPTTVKRQDLSPQTQVSATLGYADASTVSVPSGTAPSEPRAGAAVGRASARSRRSPPTETRTCAGAGIARRRSAQGRGRLPRRQRRPERRVTAAARSGRRRAGACATDAQAVTADRQSVAAATGKVQVDQQRALGRGGDARARRSRRRRPTARTPCTRCCRRSGRSSATASRCTRSAGSRRSSSTAACRPRARSCRGCRPAADVAELNREPARRTERRAATRSPRRRRVAIERFQSRASRCRRPGSCRSGRSCSSRERCG